MATRTTTTEAGQAAMTKQSMLTFQTTSTRNAGETHLGVSTTTLALVNSELLVFFVVLTFGVANKKATSHISHPRDAGVSRGISG